MAPPASDRALAEAGPIRIVRAAARSVGHANIEKAPPEARATAATLLARSGYNGRQIAALLDVAERTARRLRHTEPTSLERCVRMQIALEDQVLRTALTSWRPGAVAS